MMHNDLHMHHFCTYTCTRELLELYKCGLKRVLYVNFGLCCTCGVQQRAFSEERLEEPGESSPPTWFQGHSGDRLHSHLEYPV